MSNNQNNQSRRDFLKLSAAAAGGMSLASLGMPTESFAQAPMHPAGGANPEAIRLGFVGLGGRGSYHLSVALGMPGVRVPALCDPKEGPLYRAKRWVEDAGQPTPTLYGRGKTDFKRLCAEEDLDAVICSTSWKWHAPVCLAAMRSEKHAVSEVPIIQTLDEAWELIETWEQTGYWATLGLEQVLLESSWGLAVLNMIRQGLLGEIIHARGGYIHDLREVKYDPEEEPWRLGYSVTENGNLYPDHPMNRILPYLGINHGDRLDYLVSMSSKSMMLSQYAKEYYGKDHPYASLEFDQGDYNATLLRTVGGKMATLNFDTNTPHPRGTFRLQGSEGVYTAGDAIGEPKIYLDGRSPGHHEWEPAEKYLEKYEHPLHKNYDPPKREAALRGHGGHGRRTPLTWYLLAKALREDTMPYIDVYDSVTSSATVPLSKQSVAKNSRPVDFPDFTKGKWKSRPPFLEGIEIGRQPMAVER